MPPNTSAAHDDDSVSVFDASTLNPAAGTGPPAPMTTTVSSWVRLRRTRPTIGLSTAPVTTTTSPRPSVGPLRSTSASNVGGPGSTAAIQRSAPLVTSGPRTSAPPARKRVVIVCSEAEATTLAAAMTAISKLSPGYWSASVSSTTVQRCSDSIAVSRTSNVVERAEAFQLTRRGSSPGAYSRRAWNSLPVWPQAFIRRCCPRRPAAPTEGKARCTTSGTMSTSAAPAIVRTRAASPSTSRRSASSGPVITTPRRTVGTA